MSNAALSRARAEIESLRSRAKSARARAGKSASMVQRDAVTVAGAYAYGAARKNDIIPRTIMGTDADTATVVALYLVAHFASGTVAEVAHDAAIGIASAMAFKKAND